MMVTLFRRRALQCATLWPMAALARTAEVVRVAAASDLQFALPQVLQAHERRTGTRVVVSYAASGQLAMQIQHGAPFDLFLSADEAFVQRLQRAGLTQDEGTLYALGRLALVAGKQTDWPLDAALQGLRQRLAQGQLRRFALANPRIAPYGMRAQEALQAMGLWQGLQPHLVWGENVAQAMQFALSAEADGGVVALSLAVAPPLRTRVRYVAIAPRWHRPLRQRMVRLRRASAAAQALYAELQQPHAREVLAAHGFGMAQGGE